jgi:peptidoglycan/xylan/chitin deacetylase (PgdA/CDA1 family)
MIALTFDDGPGVHTQRVLDTLERYSAVATFCQIGRQIAGYAELDRAIVAQGSQIISHTWDHWNLTKHTDDEIRWQLETVNNALADIGVPTSRFFRPPYGSISADVQRVAAELGLTAINWNVDPRDWDHKDAQQTYDRIMDKVKDGAIILCHDIYGETADAMERVIPELIARGYQLVTIAELLEYRGIEIVAGGVIYHG